MLRSESLFGVVRELDQLPYCGEEHRVDDDLRYYLVHYAEFDWKFHGAVNLVGGIGTFGGEHLYAVPLHFPGPHPWCWVSVGEKCIFSNFGRIIRFGT